MFRIFDSIAQRGEALWLLLGRVALGVLFVPSGYGKLMDPSRMAGMLGGKGFPVPLAWAYLAGAVEVVGGIAVIVGFRARPFALLMVIFALIAAYLGHPYWTFGDAAARVQQYNHFWKDIAIAGGFLYVFVRGAGPWSLDRH